MAFTVVTIEGEGEEAEYVRLADDLIQRSALYQHLCKKNWRSCEDAGRQREIRKRWKARYEETDKQFKAYERQVNSLLKFQQRKILEARAQRVRAERRVSATNNRLNVIIQNLKKGIASKKPLEKYKRLVQQNQRFFTTRFSFRTGSQSDIVRAEMMLRTLFIYEKLKVRKEITYTEVMYLALGTQITAFRKEDVMARFPDFTHRFMRDMRDLTQAGLIAKLYRKQQYYLTTKGRERFRELIGEMYNKQMGYYWVGLLDKL